MENGAGEGPGLRGPGSQNAPDSGTSTGGIASGEPSPTGSEAPRRSSDNGGSEDSNNDSAARGLVIEKDILMVTGAVVAFTLFGAVLL
ncbi:hypothetical protein HYQ44_011634 [Verticillium longisporum]|nr:hypothetical protein HYQ44_011634 [Verticillium longisporum]